MESQGGTLPLCVMQDMLRNSNYCGSPVGRTFPSAAGFITSELFFTDDNGTYFFPTRDFHPEIEIQDGKVDLEEFLAVHKKKNKETI